MSGTCQSRQAALAARVAATSSPRSPPPRTLGGSGGGRGSSGGGGAVANGEMASVRNLYMAAEAAEAEAMALEAASGASAAAVRAVAAVEQEFVARAEVQLEADEAALRAQAFNEELELQAELEAAASRRASALGGGNGNDGGHGSGEAAADNNYETVLSLLKEADDSRKAEGRARAEVERDAAEVATLHELTTLELTQENASLRAKLRRLETESSYASAFELYDADIRSLSNQVRSPPPCPPPWPRSSVPPNAAAPPCDWPLTLRAATPARAARGDARGE